MKPCKSCPFREDSVPGLWSPAHYLAIAYLGSADIPTGSMGCHQYNGNVNPKLKVEDSPACGGWIRAARESVSVRLGMMTGGVDPDEAFDGTRVMSVERMAAVNGLDLNLLPPLRWSPDAGDSRWPDPLTWAEAVTGLRSRILADPDVALEYVIPGSPLDLGVDEETIARALGEAALEASKR